MHRSMNHWGLWWFGFFLDHFAQYAFIEKLETYRWIRIEIWKTENRTTNLKILCNICLVFRRFDNICRLVFRKNCCAVVFYPSFFVWFLLLAHYTHTTLITQVFTIHDFIFLLPLYITPALGLWLPFEMLNCYVRIHTHIHTDCISIYNNIQIYLICAFIEWLRDKCRAQIQTLLLCLLALILILYLYLYVFIFGTV